jgi:hypothetical protein
MVSGFNVVPSADRTYGTGWSEAYVGSGSYYRWTGNNLFNTGDLQATGRYVAPSTGYYITQANIRMDGANAAGGQHFRGLPSGLSRFFCVSDWYDYNCECYSYYH